MSRAQKLRKNKASKDPSTALDFYSFDFQPLYENDPRKAIKLLKFGKKGRPHETIVRLSPEKTYIEWKGKRHTFKRKAARRIYLENIESFEKGQKTYPFERYKKYFGDAESKSFSLICKDGKSLNLCAPNNEVFQTWSKGITACLRNLADLRDNINVDKRYLMSKFDNADRDKSGALSRKELLQLVASMNLNFSTKVINKVFREVDRDRSGGLDFQEFLRFMDLLRASPELDYIWNKLVNNELIGDEDVTSPFYLKEWAKTAAPEKGVPVNLDTFIKFWNDMQGERLFEKEAKVMVNEAMNDIFHGQAPVVSFAGLLKIIQSKKNDAYDPAKRILHMDMTHPLSHYFIASSHNTYLEGDQLTSKSSVNHFVDALCRGCRYVELNAWDGDNGEPIIYHGHTLANKVTFKEFIFSLKHYAFKNSPYPIILSIENHCSMEQQEKMADILVEVLSTTRDKTGDMIYKPSRHKPTNLPGNLPSPDDLKFKVLIYDKLSLELEQEDDGSNEMEGNFHYEGDSYFDSSSSENMESFIVNSTDVQMITQNNFRSFTNKRLLALSYFGTSKYKNLLRSSMRLVVGSSISNFSEEETKTNVHDDKTLANWLLRNREHMSRVYPSSTRTDSSNYDPMAAWAAGNHLVALNYQTPGLPMQLNDSLFRQNGSCGYVLKPMYMVKSAGTGELWPWEQPLPESFLNIHIISGRQLPKVFAKTYSDIDSNMNLFVLVSVHGVPEDQKEYRTSSIRCNGHSPLWDEVYSFVVNKPDVAQICFRIYDENDIKNEPPYLVAYCAIPLLCLRSGLRSVELYDEAGYQKGEYDFASLLIRTSLVAGDNSQPVYVTATYDSMDYAGEDEVKVPEFTETKREGSVSTSIKITTEEEFSL